MSALAFPQDDARAALACVPDAIVIGTYALFLRDALPAGFAVKDVDAVLPLAKVPAAVGALTAAGFACTSWNDAIDARVSLALLAGRFYVRAARAALVIDLTYECRIPHHELAAHAAEIDGARVASSEHVLALKRGRSEPRDLALLAAMR